MGVVYRATQLDLDRLVALKLIASAAGRRPRASATRFVRESRAAASIDHPNVIPIYLRGRGATGRLYIAMRYVEGDDLRTLVRREGRLPPERAAQIVSPGRRGARRRPRPRHRAPRRQAGQRPARCRRPRLPDRLRADQARCTPHTGTSRDRRLGRDARLRRARADPRRARRRAHRRLRARLRPLPRADGHDALRSATATRRRCGRTSTTSRRRSGRPSRTSRAEFEQVVAPRAGQGPRGPLPVGGRPRPRRAGGRRGSRRPRARAPGGDRRRGPGATRRRARSRRGQAQVSPRADRRRAAGDARRRRGPDARWRVAAAVGVLVAAGGGAPRSRCSGGDDDDGGDGTSSSRATTATAPAPRSGRSASAGARTTSRSPPARRGSTSSTSGRISTIDLRTGGTGELPARPAARHPSIAAGYGSLWIANQETQQITRIRLPSRRASPPHPAAARPRRLRRRRPARRVGRLARAAVRATSCASIPRTNTIVKTLSLQRGVQDLAVGERLAVGHRPQPPLGDADRVRDGRTSRFDVGDDAVRASRSAAGYAWVTSESGDSVTASTRATRTSVEIPVGRRPHGHRDRRRRGLGRQPARHTVDPHRSEDGAGRRRPVAVGANPFAVAVRGKLVFVTNLGDNTVTRITAAT